MQTRALVKERAQRNLLLVIDGIKTEEMLLANLVGITVDDFHTLRALGLISPVAASQARAPGATQPPSPRATAPAPLSAPETPAPAAAEPTPLDYASFTTALTQLISRELGLRGFVLTLAVDKAETIAELQAVAQRTLAQIQDRKGEAAAAAARRTLYGG